MTSVFDDMLRRSIPEYGEMRAAVAALASSYSRDLTTVVDLGCSRGEALATVRDRVRRESPGADVRFVGCEVSGPMLDAARERFAGQADVEVLDVDLRRIFPPLPLPASVVLSVLTLQFVPVNYRQRIISAAYKALLPGGAFLLVEKVLGASDGLDDAFVDLYHRLKRENGYSEEDVLRKAVALEGVLAPLTARWNEDLLLAAGFKHIDCFWAWMNFRAWVAVR